ncbi:hypothetical protein JCM16358_03810 [Halanaerocella petrolearia]
MNKSQKKELIEMLMKHISREVDINPWEFAQLAQELAQQWNSKDDKSQLYQEISPGLYRRVEFIKE